MARYPSEKNHGNVLDFRPIVMFSWCSTNLKSAKSLMSIMCKALKNLNFSVVVSQGIEVKYVLMKKQMKNTTHREACNRHIVKVMVVL